MVFVSFVSSGVGIGYSLLALIGLVVKREGFGSEEIGYLGLIITVGGLLGALIASIIENKYRKVLF